MAEELLLEDIFVIAFSFPVVPKVIFVKYKIYLIIILCVF
jgi:hypothetical protein